LIGDTGTLRSLRPEKFADDTVGVLTVADILGELEKPGRDPRPAFTTATFADGVEKVTDLRPGMILEGVVTNVAAFGAFVDIGVHQDGLVHVSAMSTSFVSDPREVVRSGQVVKVKVMEVDVDRKRIGLSLRLSDEPGRSSRSGGRPADGGARRPGGSGAAQNPTGSDRRGGDRGRAGGSNRPAPDAGGSLADALRRAGCGR